MAQDRIAIKATTTEKLGFVVKHDVPVGVHRWLTVVSPEAPDGTELLLEPSEHPAAKSFKSALVKDGIPAASFMDEVLKVATDLADGPTRALAMAKEGFHRALNSTLAEAEDWEYTVANRALRAGPEYREGVTAFMEKRQPQFHGAAGSGQ